MKFDARDPRAHRSLLPAPELHRGRPLGLALGQAALLLFATSCVAQSRYEETQAEAQYYERLYQDLESYQGKLEAENERLRGDLDLYRNEAPLEASWTQDIDQRMAELQRIAGGLGAPGDVTVLQVEGGYGLRLSDAILFESGKAEVLPAGRELLLRMAKEIQSRQHVRIWVRGHTDSDPVSKASTRERFPHGNLQLSAARAIEVASVLVEEGGIDTKKMVVAGFGPNDPVAKNDSAENKHKNRRVDIFVIEDAESPAAR
jgi:chemotaxis protein MotB